MKFIKTIFIFLALNCITAKAQNTKADSLEKVLANHSRIDIAKVDIMNELAYTIFSSDAEKARSYGNQSLRIATELKYQKGKAASLWIIGLAAMDSNKRISRIFPEST